MSSSHTCAVTAAGRVSCWGINSYGTLGRDPSIKESPLPLEVAGISDVRQVATGFLFTCALRGDGTVWCWGDNFHGMLADGTLIERATPARALIVGDDVEEITAGIAHACARTRAGTVRCWGANYWGQLGGGTFDDDRASRVSTVLNLDNVVKISAGGGSMTCALRRDGSVWCWGGNFRGQLGNGTYMSSAIPTEVVSLPPLR